LIFSYIRLFLAPFTPRGGMKTLLALPSEQCARRVRACYDRTPL
jgi:hypothetical protein